MNLVVSLVVWVSVSQTNYSQLVQADGGARAPVATDARTQSDSRPARAEPPLADSAFATWWNVPERAKLPAAIRSTCKALPAAATNEQKEWCAKYFSASAKTLATEFDLPLVIESAPMAMAAWILDPALLTTPLQQFEDAFVSVAKLDELDGSESKNTPLGLDAVAGLLPGVDLAAMVNKILAGFEKAIEERAEKEAVAFVLEQVSENLCAPTPEGKVGVPEWLPATCSAAAAGAYSGGLGSGALSSLALLQRSLEADLRTFPGKAARLGVERATALPDGTTTEFRSTAEPVQKLVDDVVEGTHPLRALEDFGATVGGDTSTKVQALGCMATQPAARLRAMAAVAEASQGMRPQASRIEKAMASTLLSLQATGCQTLLKTTENVAAIRLWTQHVSALRASAIATSELFVALERLKEPIPTPTGTPLEKMAQVGQEMATRVTTSLDAVDAALALVKEMGGDVDKDLRKALSQARNVVALISTAMSGNLAQLFQELLMHQTAPGRVCVRAPCVTLPDPLLRYGGMLVAIVGAQTSDDVKAAVLAAASPAGTWKTKYRAEAAPVVTLGGLMGFAGSTSDFKGVSVRMVVPLGVDVTFLHWTWFNFGFFTQVLDLAGYSSYVYHYGGEVRPFQSLSPGVHLRLGIAGAPVMLTVGGGYDVDTGEAIPRGAGWFRFGLALDATLFLLYRK